MEEINRPPIDSQHQVYETVETIGLIRKDDVDEAIFIENMK